MKKQQIGKRGLGLMALALSIACSLAGERIAMAQSADPEAEGNVVIWLNNTDTATDDVLPQGGSLPCQAHLEGAGKDMTVVLVIPPLSSTNSARRLSFFNTSTVSTITLTLKKDATPSPFTIYGINGSLDVGVGKIEAHKDTATGGLKTTGAASVYWFDNPQISVSAGGTYSTTSKISGDQAAVLISPEPGPGAYLTASIELKPSRSLANAPQLSSLQVGVVQNSYQGNGYVAEYDTTNTNAVDAYVKLSSLVAKKADDVASGYIGPTYANPASLSAGVEYTSDTPLVQVPSSILDEAHNVTYHLMSLSFDNAWDDWCALVDQNVVSAERWKSNANPYAGVSARTQDSGWNLHVKVNERATASMFHYPGSAGSMILTFDANQFANNLAPVIATPHN